MLAAAWRLGARRPLMESSCLVRAALEDLAVPSRPPKKRCASYRSTSTWFRRRTASNPTSRVSKVNKQHVRRIPLQEGIEHTFLRRAERRAILQREWSNKGRKCRGMVNLRSGDRRSKWSVGGETLGHGRAKINKRTVLVDSRTGSDVSGVRDSQRCSQVEMSLMRPYRLQEFAENSVKMQVSQLNVACVTCQQPLTASSYTLCPGAYEMPGTASDVIGDHPQTRVLMSSVLSF